MNDSEEIDGAADDPEGTGDLAETIEEGAIEDVAYAYTIGMTDEETDRRLREGSVGVLSLADDGDSYAIPVAYHYDGDAVYIRLGLHADSRKTQMLQTTDTACFLLYDADPIEESWSVMATGSMRRVDDSSNFSDEVINSLFVPLRVFGEPIEGIEPAVFELEVESLTGRRATEE